MNTIKVISWSPDKQRAQIIYNGRTHHVKRLNGNRFQVKFRRGPGDTDVQSGPIIEING